MPPGDAKTSATDLDHHFHRFFAAKEQRFLLAFTSDKTTFASECSARSVEVCVWNRSPADLEVRFLSASEDMAPVLPTAQHCTDARIFDRGDGDAVPAGDSGGEAPDGEAVDGAEGVLQLKAGQLLSAPLAAQLRMGQSILQVRPATGVRHLSIEKPESWWRRALVVVCCVCRTDLILDLIKG